MLRSDGPNAWSTQSPVGRWSFSFGMVVHVCFSRSSAWPPRISSIFAMDMRLPIRFGGFKLLTDTTGCRTHLTESIFWSFPVDPEQPSLKAP